MVIGSPHYMPVEQASGARDLDARVDQYALAVILYQALTRTRPFENDYRARPRQGPRRRQPPDVLRDIRPRAAASLEAVVLRGMARDRDDRYASLPEFLSALEATTHEDRTLAATSTLELVLPSEEAPFALVEGRVSSTGPSSRGQRAPHSPRRARTPIQARRSRWSPSPPRARRSGGPWLGRAAGRHGRRLVAPLRRGEHASTRRRRGRRHSAAGVASSFQRPGVRGKPCRAARAAVCTGRRHVRGVSVSAGFARRPGSRRGRAGTVRATSREVCSGGSSAAHPARRPRASSSAPAGRRGSPAAARRRRSAPSARRAAVRSTTRQPLHVTSDSGSWARGACHGLAAGRHAFGTGYIAHVAEPGCAVISSTLRVPCE